ncbi:hypothetical protein ACFQZE_06590 [Paenibacillus sp. GCM10027627]|uniref:hypothetical protein n=1 Tax=unclassified Paenibacillus TaxID=185978 RepID=UPI0036344EA3
MKTDVVEKMRKYIDEVIELEEKLEAAKDQERFWRSECTTMINRLNELKREAKGYSDGLFSE